MLALAVSLLFGLAAVASLAVIGLAFHAAAKRAPQILAELAELEGGARTTAATWARDSRSSPRLCLRLAAA